jgi:hypothetical protein
MAAIYCGKFDMNFAVCEASTGIRLLMVTPKNPKTTI